MQQLLFNGRVFNGESLLNNCAVLLEGNIVKEILPEPLTLSTDIPQYDLNGHILAPGLIDIQVNGGGGVLFNNSPDIETLKTMAMAHRRFATTGFLPTLISSDTAITRQAIESVTAAIDSGVPGILGLHLEGPFLNPDSRGIHAAEKIRSLDDASIELLTAPRSGVLMLTIAPELVTAAQITHLNNAGVLVFGGHSCATYAQTKTALAAGMRGFTHLFNAMPPFLSRAPGMVGAALEDKNSWFGIIADGQHVHPAALAVAVAAKKRGRALLVTDAMATVGSANKTFVLDGSLIQEVDGCCRNSVGELAGSALDMLTAVANTLKFTDLDLPEALRMASTYPAHALKLEGQFGYIKPGYQASFIELDDDLNLYRSWVNGAPDS